MLLFYRFPVRVTRFVRQPLDCKRWRRGLFFAVVLLPQLVSSGARRPLAASGRLDAFAILKQNKLDIVV